MAATVRHFPGAAKAGAGAVTTTPARPDRKGKRVIAGHFNADTFFAFHQLLAHIARQTGEDFPVQQSVAVALRFLFQKYAPELMPDELKQAVRPACRARAKSSDRDPTNG